MCKKPYMRSRRGLEKNGKYRESREHRLNVTPFPCGMCLHCRINKARVWKLRILLEASQYEASTFSTLTYNEQNIPADRSLQPKDLTNFLKKLRRRLDIEKKKIRYFAIGEYGNPPRIIKRGPYEYKTEGYRPHYHAMLFGLCPMADADVINDAWGKGDVHVGMCENDSAAYIVGYVTEKLGKADDENSPVAGKEPVFMRCSKQKGGLGYQAVEKMAKVIQGNPNIKPEIIRKLRINGGYYPLGRYLTRRMANYLGMDENDFARDFHQYQSELFDEYGTTGDSYDNIINENSQARLNQKRRREIFQKGKWL